ncbi:gliding motility-associated peptidyl-prolyl isomerase GldI [Pseudofulvibacter geojedonensis]|uniref:Peptidyl-prolyl cis-trans isomerase n=1 Tax=Pseudofulvibacter geojedonensis TaxID=1123758 RepID=A0ABW3I337_9FLAO
MRYLYLIIAFVLFSCNACQEPEARKPVSVKSGSTYSKSAERTKKLLEKENQLIDNYIKIDSLNSYKQSQHGFSYAYIKQDTTTNVTPFFGNKVVFKYHITDLNNNPIYTEEELGIQSYRVDQQNIMNGLRKGLKLMRVNETIKCVFPSQIAYGYKGDRNKIKPNTPIVCTITLNEILTLNEKK